MYSLGKILEAAFPNPPEGLSPLIRRLTSSNAEERPPVNQVADDLLEYFFTESFFPEYMCSTTNLTLNLMKELISNYRQSLPWRGRCGQAHIAQGKFLQGFFRLVEKLGDDFFAPFTIDEDYAENTGFYFQRFFDEARNDSTIFDGNCLPAGTLEFPYQP